MSKRPAEQWYTGDWYRAVDVQKCGPTTRGIWRDALDAMTNEQITGRIRGTREEIARLLRCNDEELQGFFDDNKEHGFADVTFRYGKVTIVCRRLYRAYLEREATKMRVRKSRKSVKRKCNDDVTPLSSTSTSTSSSLIEKQPQSQSTEGRTTEGVGIDKKSLDKGGLELEKEIKTTGLRFIESLEQTFASISKDEATTFSRIAVYLSDLVRRSQAGIEIFGKALEWAEDATTRGAKNPKGLFVAKVKQETGFRGRGLLLKDGGE